MSYPTQIICFYPGLPAPLPRGRAGSYTNSASSSSLTLPSASRLGTSRESGHWGLSVPLGEEIPQEM